MTNEGSCYKFISFYLIILSINYYNNYFLISSLCRLLCSAKHAINRLENNLTLVLRAFKLERIRNNLCMDKIYSFLSLVAVNNYLSQL